jgi:serine/threonine protein kinase
MIDLTYNKKKISYKGDVWALGCILYALAFYVNPFENSGDLGFFFIFSKFVFVVKGFSMLPILIQLKMNGKHRKEVSFYNRSYTFYMIRKIARKNRL